MILHVVLGFQNFFTLDIEKTVCITSLKRRISDRSNIPVCCFTLCYGIFDLSDKENLNTYGIRNDSIIYVKLIHNNMINCECIDRNNFDSMLSQFNSLNI